MSTPDAPPSPGPLETVRAKYLFTLSALFLLVLGWLLHQQLSFNDPERLWTELQNPNLVALLILLLALWPLFLLDAVVRFWQRDRTRGFWSQAGSALLLGLLPPLRLAARSPGTGTHVWLPGLEWRLVDRHLRRKLERLFSVPMILLALLVLPLLIIECFWPEQSQSNPQLRSFLEIGSSVIWCAFACEFIIQVQVSDKKGTYCLTHWIDLIIILLPVVQFLPLLRAMRLARLLRTEQLGRMSMSYRMQALALRAWQAFLLLQIVQRLIGWSLEKRLNGLQAQLAAKMEEMEDLRLEIEEVRQKIEEQKTRSAVGVSGGEAERPLSETVGCEPAVNEK